MPIHLILYFSVSLGIIMGFSEGFIFYFFLRISIHSKELLGISVKETIIHFLETIPLPRGWQGWLLPYHYLTDLVH